MRKILVLLTLALLLVTTLVIGFTKDRTNQRSALPEDSQQGQAQIGGDFTLTDTAGRIVHDTDFRGRVMLVFFGFTHCPDICPVTVATLSRLLESLDPHQASQLAPLFITVDPKRDTPAVLASYLSSFDKRLIGLTGTPEQVHKAAGAYRAYYAKHDAKGGDKEDYAVDHSGFIYLMGKDGTFIQVMPYDTPVEELRAQILPYLE